MVVSDTGVKLSTRRWTAVRATLGRNAKHVTAVYSPHCFLLDHSYPTRYASKSFTLLDHALCGLSCAYALPSPTLVRTVVDSLLQWTVSCRIYTGLPKIARKIFSEGTTLFTSTFSILGKAVGLGFPSALRLRRPLNLPSALPCHAHRLRRDPG